jgi:hypothetical protein
MAGLVNHPHATAPDLGKDLVITDLLGSGKNHPRGFSALVACGDLNGL